jgi:hypothetical protein
MRNVRLMADNPNPTRYPTHSALEIISNAELGFIKLADAKAAQ